ncbi:GTPase [Chloroflexota bacterium]
MAIHHVSYIIEKEGAAQVIDIGPSNVGKSQLVSSLTNASPTVAEYPFTTHQLLPGIMGFNNIRIQLIDTPPLVPQNIEP